MAKTYVDTVKYMVYANIEIDGLVEKPDVVGAVFGQTEGLLGDELDLRELQKNGRIGRIEVDLQVRGGKSVGKLTLPSSLDMVETSILAAALETVDRVGPCEARITVEKIEDTRNAKRKMVVERAKTLLKNLLTHEIPESKELSELVRAEVKVAEISEYGPEKLPCGPNITSYDSLIVVEGRADVLNLLKNDVNNVIAVGGANVPKSLVALCAEKEVTAFLDGDRGGDIILRELVQATDIDFVARAPPGKEVEELTRKEIIKALRARVPIDQIEGLVARRKADREAAREELRKPAALQEIPAPVASAQTISPQLMASLAELENTLRARLYDEAGNLKSEVPVRDLIKALSEGEAPHAIVFDGIITQRLVDLAESRGTKVLLGVKMGNVFRRPAGMLIATK
ncbi:MAG: DNA primase DnaG [Candidatus Micrarchaeia archaeon]